MTGPATMDYHERQLLYGTAIEVDPRKLWLRQWGGNVIPLLDGPAARAAFSGFDGPDAEAYRATNLPYPGSVCGDLEMFRRMCADVREGAAIEPVHVAIDEAGRVVLTDGRHRSIAAALAGRTIPAEIVWRSGPWWRVLSLLHGLSDAVRLYQPIDHPDLASWPVHRTDSAARAAALLALLPARARVLDWSCHTGYFCRALAAAGHRAVGVDADARAVEVARFLDPAGDYRTADLPPEPSGAGYDAALCLSLLNHHATDGRSDLGHDIFRRLVALAPLVVLDAPAPGDPVGGDTALVEPEAMIAWLAASGAPGRGEVVAPRGDALQRPLIAWRR